MRLVKAVLVDGSPRKRNTHSLIEAICRTLERSIDVELIRLAELDIRQCRGTDEYCLAHNSCHIRDGMQQIYPKLKDADIIVIGTPTYYWNVSGFVKTFIDRCLPLYHKRLLRNKMAASVAVSEVDGQNLALAAISSFFRLNEMKEIGSLSIARGKNDVGDREIESARAFGKMIAGRINVSNN